MVRENEGATSGSLWTRVLSKNLGGLGGQHGRVVQSQKWQHLQGSSSQHQVPHFNRAWKKGQDGRHSASTISEGQHSKLHVSDIFTEPIIFIIEIKY